MAPKQCRVGPQYGKNIKKREIQKARKNTNPTI